MQIQNRVINLRGLSTMQIMKGETLLKTVNLISDPITRVVMTSEYNEYHVEVAFDSGDIITFQLSKGTKNYMDHYHVHYAEFEYPAAKHKQPMHALEMVELHKNLERLPDSCFFINGKRTKNPFTKYEKFNALHLLTKISIENKNNEEQKIRLELFKIDQRYDVLKNYFCGKHEDMMGFVEDWDQTQITRGFFSTFIWYLMFYFDKNLNTANVDEIRSFFQYVNDGVKRGKYQPNYANQLEQIVRFYENKVEYKNKGEDVKRPASNHSNPHINEKELKQLENDYILLKRSEMNAKKVTKGEVHDLEIQLKSRVWDTYNKKTQARENRKQSTTSSYVRALRDMSIFLLIKENGLTPQDILNIQWGEQQVQWQKIDRRNGELKFDEKGEPIYLKEKAEKAYDKYNILTIKPTKEGEYPFIVVSSKVSKYLDEYMELTPRKEGKLKHEEAYLFVKRMKTPPINEKKYKEFLKEVESLTDEEKKPYEFEHIGNDIVEEVFKSYFVFFRDEEGNTMPNKAFKEKVEIELAKDQSYLESIQDPKERKQAYKECVLKAEKAALDYFVPKYHFKRGERINISALKMRNYFIEQKMKKENLTEKQAIEKLHTSYYTIKDVIKEKEEPKVLPVQEEKEITIIEVEALKKEMVKELKSIFFALKLDKNMTLRGNRFKGFNHDPKAMFFVQDAIATFGQFLREEQKNGHVHVNEKEITHDECDYCAGDEEIVSATVSFMDGDTFKKEFLTLFEGQTIQEKLQKAEEFVNRYHLSHREFYIRVHVCCPKETWTIGVR